MILGDGADALTPGAGGGAGGSILLEAPHFLGENSSVLSFGAPKVFLKKKLFQKWLCQSSTVYQIFKSAKELGPRTAKLTLLICLKIHMIELV